MDPDLRLGNSYESLITGDFIDTANAPESKLVKKLYGSHNDSRSPTEAEKQLVLEWIREGAKNN